MARRLNTLSARMFLMMLLVHVITLPALFYGLKRIVENNVVESFIDDARNYAYILAGTFEADETLLPGGDIVEHLDGAMLGGRIHYVAIVMGDRLILSSLLTDEEGENFQEDFHFGEHGDESYNMTVPIGVGDQVPFLRLGFDESVTRENLKQVNGTIMAALLVYLLTSSMIAMLFSTRILQSIHKLQRVSREIISGDHKTRLSVDTKIIEIRQLSDDLEAMRSKLVGLNSRLHEEIAEREAAEAGQRALESRLRHAQRLESLGTLAGGVAHEFNNVLQPLLLYTDLAIEDTPEDSPARRNLERVVTLAYDAKGLSQQILTFGRVDSETELRIIDLGPMVEEALAMVTALLPATADIRGSVETVPPVKCDPRQILQLIVNLCSNAFQSLLGGSGHIGIRYYVREVTAEFAAIHTKLKDGAHAVIEVSDTGRGMNDATLRRIFEPFFTMQEVGEGTGLGLSVVHGIVTRHGGEITVDSELGKGTVFRVYLPVADGVVRDDRED